ncbi:hypothetical protein [Alloprevotella tannerae]|uniref:hypothetical protein n=1 Tax=Alloprevotella tannerae TaxID=76122 RepID=UPI0025D20222|nr:hypothetical protein [Alloprevotella tannerae]
MKQYLFLLLSLAGLATTAQTAIGLDQQALKQWSIGTANFSGITKIDDTRYAVVSHLYESGNVFGQTCRAIQRMLVRNKLDLLPANGVYEVYIQAARGVHTAR